MSSVTVPIAPLQARFLAILPQIERQAQVYFRYLDAERKEEATAEMVALSWRWFLRLVERGKDPLAFPVVLAHYAARHVKCGRRLCGQETGKDVMSRLAQRRHDFRVESLPTSMTSSFEERYSMVRGQHRQDALEERLCDNTQTPVPEQVCFRLDFPAWLLTQTDRTRRIIDAMAVGERTQDLAQLFGLTPGRISQIRRELHKDWCRYQGDDPDVG
jgi:hypothetical protein